MQVLKNDENLDCRKVQTTAWRAWPWTVKGWMAEVVEVIAQVLPRMRHEERVCED